MAAFASPRALCRFLLQGLHLALVFALDLFEPLAGLLFLLLSCLVQFVNFCLKLGLPFVAGLFHFRFQPVDLPVLRRNFGSILVNFHIDSRRAEHQTVIFSISTSRGVVHSSLMSATTAYMPGISIAETSSTNSALTPDLYRSLVAPTSVPAVAPTMTPKGPPRSPIRLPIAVPPRVSRG